MTVRQPLVEAVLDYASQQVYPLHTPGHKGGRGMTEPLRSALGSAALSMDVSLMSELDDLHAPQGAIKAAQDAAAKLYGSDACFFSVNGTTGAIHAMLLAALKPGDKILVPRNAHKSVYGALVLSGAEPVYAFPEYIGEFGLYGQITPAQVEAAFACEPKLAAVLLTTPNYYGLAADTAAIAKITHDHGALLLVDEAHGAHLGFSRILPPSALECGADLVAQSTHKLTGAMTQCSMLHARGARLDLTRVADAMSLLTTTSPNYLLLSSLDAARAQLQERGTMMASQAVIAADELRHMLRSFDGLRVMTRSIVGKGGAAGYDETKVTLNVCEWPFTGIEVADALRNMGIAVELADAENILFLVTYADYGSQWKPLVAAVRQVLSALQRMIPERSAKLRVQDGADEAKKVLTCGKRMPKPDVKISLRSAFYGEREMISLREAAGRVSAEAIAFYPPGIPFIVPGETFTPAVLDYCEKQLELGIPVHASNASLETVLVLRE